MKYLYILTNPCYFFVSKFYFEFKSVSSFFNEIIYIFVIVGFPGGSAYAGTYEDAIKAKNNKDYNTAVSIFEELCTKGNTDSCSEVGVIYSKEFKNYQKAMEFFQIWCWQ